MMFVLRSRRVRSPSKAGWLVGAALVAGAVMLAGTAQAAPLAAATSAAVALESDVVQVRDGCGRGLRFSNRRNRCVPIEREFEGDGGDYRDQDRRRSRRGDGDGDAAAGAVAAGVLLGIVGATAIQNNRRGNRGNAVQGGNSVGTKTPNGGPGKRKRH